MNLKEYSQIGPLGGKVIRRLFFLYFLCRAPFPCVADSGTESSSEDDDGDDGHPPLAAAAPKASEGTKAAKAVKATKAKKPAHGSQGPALDAQDQLRRVLVDRS